MDVLVATQQYVSEMVRLAGPGMKVLLMDKETTSIISCAFSQSEMMQKEIYLFERIDTGSIREPIKFLKCVCFLRPTQENLLHLQEELRNPRYAQYYIYFSNIIPKADVKLLAEADEQETVREFHEYYADFISIAPHLGTLGSQLCYENPFNMIMPIFRRSIQAIIASLLSLRKRPALRFQKTSRDAQRMCSEIKSIMAREDALFEGCKSDTLLIILDRSQDPITPLLNQWTYEAMVHEIFGINNNRVFIENASDAQKNLVLSAQHDEFYAKNMYLNFGEIGQNIKTLMSEYQRKAQMQQQLESISDMKKFVEQYPQFKKISGTVTKHVQVVGEMSRIVTDQNLMRISEVEQTIVHNGEHNECLEAIKQLIQHPKTSELNAVRLVMLYALRFENHSSNSLQILIAQLRHRGISARYTSAIRTLLDYGGIKRRQHDLFGNQSAIGLTKRFIKGLKGVENVFTQHEPYISQLIDQAAKGKLSETSFPSLDYAQPTTRYENIILFMVGGLTYEESAFAYSYNQKHIQNPGLPKILLMSNYVHNTRSFVDQLLHINGNSQSSSIGQTA